MSGNPGYPSVLREESARWPVGAAGVAVINDAGVAAVHGDERVHPWASVTKLLTALTVLDAVSRAVLSLDEPAGPPGATVRHLLAHAAGLHRDDDRVQAPPGTRRIYSNSGYEVLAQHLERRAGEPFVDLLHGRLLAPLGMHSTQLAGSPAHGARGPVGDLARLAAELLRPHRLAADLVETARTPAFPELAGVLPGFGRQTPNDWGLGPELRGAKSPHWTSPDNAPTTFGHFGQAGSFLWVDPVARVACVSVCDTPFGPWAAKAWPALASRVLAAARPDAVPPDR